MKQFMLWYSQAGTPEVVATGSYDARGRTYRLDVAQTVPATPGQPNKEPMAIPLAVGLVGRDGRDLPLKLADGRTIERGVLALTKPAESFVFGGVGEPPVPSLNRGFSAPIKLVANISADDLRFLAAHDSDTFNRWQSVQTLASRLLLDNTAALRAGRAERRDAGLVDARSAATSTPMRSSRHARRCGRRSGESSRARCSIITGGFPKAAPIRPTPRARGGARCATPVSIFWWRRAGQTPSRLLHASIGRPTT
jgi:aminopeptidase N